MSTVHVIDIIFENAESMEAEKKDQKETERLVESKPPVTINADSARVALTPIEGTDNWVDGLRYLIAPAIIATCPTDIFQLFDRNENDQSGNKMFSKVVMGAADIAQIKSKGLLKEECEWSQGNFELHQNYLIEYENSSETSERPRGFAFLQNASIRRHESIPCAIRMDYFQNTPESSSRKSVSRLFIHLIIQFSVRHLSYMIPANIGFISINFRTGKRSLVFKASRCCAFKT